MLLWEGSATMKKSFAPLVTLLGSTSMLFSRWVLRARRTVAPFLRDRVMLSAVGITVAATALVILIAGCALQTTTFRMIAGSGNATFEPILKRFAKEKEVDLQIDYKGSLDIMQLLEQPNFAYDAIWDADSLWTSMASTPQVIKNRESIMRSPVVFGLKKSLAQKLGWVGKDVPIEDILTAAEKENLRLMMTSATQSNSGASAYLGFLYAFAKPDGVLTEGDLKKPEVRASLKRILGTIDRTSESSGWLRDLFAQQYNDFDGMFNYESHIIELNQKLVQTNREPLCIVYPTPGLGIADFPLSYVSHGDAKKESFFKALQDYLLSDAVQKEIAARGRRVGAVGASQVDPNAFKADWCADVAKGQAPLRTPDKEVVREALDLYQTSLRKPSFTVYALDFSGSMKGNGEQQLKAAMRTLLDQDEARKYLLQGSPDDITIVIPFDDTIMNDGAIAGWTVEGNDAVELKSLLGEIESTQTRNATNIYLPLAVAMKQMKDIGVGDRFPAIILMTDGKANKGSIFDVKNAIGNTGLTNVPVYGITFGDADRAQLDELANLTHGRVFDGTKDLISAFRAAKGNN